MLPAIRFHPQDRDARNTAGSIPGGLEAHLIRTIGGHVIDIGPITINDGNESSTGRSTTETPQVTLSKEEV